MGNRLYSRLARKLLRVTGFNSMISSLERGSFERSLLRQIALAPRPCIESEKILGYILDHVMPAYKLRQASVVLVDAQGGLENVFLKNLDPATHTYIKGRSAGKCLVGDALMRAALSTGRPRFGGESAQAFVSLPLIAHGRSLGVLNLVWHPGAVTRAPEAGFLTQLAAVSAGVMDSSGLFEQRDRAA